MLRAEVRMRSVPFPQPVATFVGRRDELARIGDLLQTCAVTLVYGVAGIGKTELCYRAIADARARFGHVALWRVSPGAGLDAAAAALVRRRVRHGRDLEAITNELAQ